MPLSETRKCDGIFGTPLEPLFNNVENGTNPEILQDWLINMAVTNSETLKSEEKSENIFNHGHWAHCIFLMCDRFELPHQTKFAALELFDRFMARHINDLYAHVQNSGSSKKKSDWACILDRVKNQTFLRIVSCCQIASKLTSHYKVITVKRARKCLLEAGYSYSNESIIQSEMRILKTLQYNVSQVSCLDFLEMLLEILGHNAGRGVLDLKVYYDTAIKILSLVCLNRHEVYDRLYLNTAGICAGVLVSSQEQK
ncbi:cyclin N-terminal domain-containing protein 1-like [Elysia marginata]|uniref:Cyclin N-terminal domain-containing protein 1-like n=1 Tax=Elysia marginata TaxID=1093978 RepID=A0AAV4JSK0_9GAST|nr:cyclin N-terminal domain-containing protein 1-like [Elysia marginata]